MRINVNVPSPPPTATATAAPLPHLHSIAYLSPYTPCLTPSPASGSSVASSPSPSIQVGGVPITAAERTKDLLEFQQGELATYQDYTTHNEFYNGNTYSMFHDGGAVPVNAYHSQQQQHQQQHYAPDAARVLTDSFSAYTPTAKHAQLHPPFASSPSTPSSSVSTAPPTHPAPPLAHDGTPPRKRPRHTGNVSASAAPFLHLHSVAEPVLSPSPITAPSQLHPNSQPHPKRIAPAPPPQGDSSQAPSSGSPTISRGRGRGTRNRATHTGTAVQPLARTRRRDSPASDSFIPSPHTRIHGGTSNTTFPLAPTRIAHSNDNNLLNTAAPATAPIKFRFVTVHTVAAPSASTARQVRKGGQGSAKVGGRKGDGDGKGRGGKRSGMKPNDTRDGTKDGGGVKVEGGEELAFEEGEFRGGSGEGGGRASRVITSKESRDGNTDSNGQAGELYAYPHDSVDSTDVSNIDSHSHSHSHSRASPSPTIDIPSSPRFLLAEHLDSDDEDFAPFEHGPTELPPRAYSPGPGGVGKVWMSGKGGAGAWGGGGGSSGNGYGYISGNGELAGAGKPGNRGVFGPGRAHGHAGKQLGLLGHNAPPPATYVSVHGRVKAVGKIPASELEFLPFLEARFAALERAIGRVVQMCAERAVKNSMLPGTGREEKKGKIKDREEGQDGIVDVEGGRVMHDGDASGAGDDDEARPEMN